MKKMYDLYETYVGLRLDGNDNPDLRSDILMHFSFVSEYSQPYAHSHEDGAFNIRKFFETFLGIGYQQCLGLGPNVPDTFYRFFVDFEEECIYISGTGNEFTIPFAKIDIDSSSTRAVAERSYITEDF